MTSFQMKLSHGWYPKEEQTCKREIQKMIVDFHPSHPHRTGGIVPHAGWYFSGKLSARVIYTLALNNPSPDVVCLIGGHLGMNDPVYYLDFDQALTPIGNILIQRELTQEIVGNLDKKKPDPNNGDNTIEINLPFIRYFFPDIPLIAFRTPPSQEAVEFGQLLARIASEKNLNLIVIGGADLTHYGPNYGFISQGEGREAVKWVKEENDRQIIDAVLSGKLEEALRLGRKSFSTCSGGALVTPAAFASQISDQPPVLLDYYTSYDVYPSPSFVGYVGILF